MPLSPETIMVTSLSVEKSLKLAVSDADILHSERTSELIKGMGLLSAVIFEEISKE